MISARLKIYFSVALISAVIIALIGYYYTEKDLPPYPDKVVTESGKVLTGRDRIMAGQKVFQKYGLMALGSVWGHGTYRGPDFTAQALHRMGESMREALARQNFSAAYDSLPTESRGSVDAVVIEQIKTNRYDKITDTLTFSAIQEAAFLENQAFYLNLFTHGD